MVLTIEPTSLIEQIAGVQCRMWRGATDLGTACEVWVAMVTVPNTPAARDEMTGLETAMAPKASFR